MGFGGCPHEREGIKVSSLEEGAFSFLVFLSPVEMRLLYLWEW